jgi:hypothetical protein
MLDFVASLWNKPGLERGKAEGRRQKAEGRRQSSSSVGKLREGDRQRTTDDGQLTAGDAEVRIGGDKR